MSLIADDEYIIHQLRVSFLRLHDRTAERVITFDADTVYGNAYIKTAGPNYPEMDYCYSPDIPYQRDRIAFNKPSSSTLLPLASQRIKPLNRQRWAQPTTTAVAQEIASENNVNDSEDDFDMEDEDEIPALSEPILFEKSKPNPVVATNSSSRVQEQNNLKIPVQNFAGKMLGFDMNPGAATNSGAELLLPHAYIPAAGGSPPPKSTLDTDQKHEFPNPFGSKKNVSALSALIQGKGESAVDNPFSAEFSSVSGIGEPNVMTIKIFLPHSEEPMRPLEIVVKRDATVEQVIGYTLHRFCEEGRKPLLDEKLSDVVHWSMRIVEDDGTIDEDFPALDRTRQISKFFFDQFAICEATPAQVKVNERLRLKKPSREMLRKVPSAQNIRRPSATPIPIAASSSQAHLNTSEQSGGIKVDSTQVPPAPPPPSFHRLKVYFFSPTSTTLSTTIIIPVRTTFMDIRSQVCRKWRLDKDDYILIIADTTTEIPLDKTVNDYQKVSELVLLNKGSALGVSAMSLKPAGDINRRGDKPYSLSRSIIPESMDSSRFYKSFKVNRKTRLLGLHERILDIIGEYIHILPSENRGRFDSVKTANYKIRDILICKQSSKNRRKFKLVIDRGLGDSKTYIFIGDTVEETTEICNIIKHFMQTLNRDDRTRNFLTTNAISPRSFGDSFRSLDLSGAGTPMHPGSK